MQRRYMPFKSHYRLLQITYGRSTNIYKIIIDDSWRQIFLYTTLLPVLTNKVFPGNQEIFGIKLGLMCAIGGIIATY